MLNCSAGVSAADPECCLRTGADVAKPCRGAAAPEKLSCCQVSDRMSPSCSSRMSLNVIGFQNCLSPSCAMSHHAAALQRHAAVVNVIAVVHYVTQGCRVAAEARAVEKLSCRRGTCHCCCIAVAAHAFSRHNPHVAEAAMQIPRLLALNPKC